MMTLEFAVVRPEGSVTEEFTLRAVAPPYAKSAGLFPNFAGPQVLPGMRLLFMRALMRAISN